MILEKEFKSELKVPLTFKMVAVSKSQSFNLNNMIGNNGSNNGLEKPPLNKLFSFASPQVVNMSSCRKLLSGTRFFQNQVSSEYDVNMNLKHSSNNENNNNNNNTEELLRRIDFEFQKQSSVADQHASKRYSVAVVEAKWKSSPNGKNNNNNNNEIARKSVILSPRPESTDGTATSPGYNNKQQQQQQQQKSNVAPSPRPNSTTNNNNNNSNSNNKDDNSVVDMARLKRMLPSLVAKQRQSFNSSEFYTFGRVLGEGAYGKVKLGTHLLTSEKVAVKTFEKSRLADPNSRRRVTREIRILKALSHPHVIKLYEVIDCPTRKYIIMELAPGGDLCKYVREHRRLSEAESCRLFGQIVDGLLYCHDSGIVHRDIKLDNLLMDENKNIKIVDFGFSVNFKEGQKLRKACGSPSYAAPEIVSRKPYNPPGVDIWSLGVVLYAMICGYFPFQGSNNQDLCRKIVKGRFETPEWMSPEARDLVRRMLVIDPEKRLPLRSVKNHPWCRASLSSIPASMMQQPQNLQDIDFEKSDDSQIGDRQPVLSADTEILEQMQGLGFSKDYALFCVTRNLHNIASTSYWLLQNRKYSTLRKTPSMTANV